MGLKAKKKAGLKNLKKAAAQFSGPKGDAAEFLVCYFRDFSFRYSK